MGLFSDETKRIYDTTTVKVWQKDMFKETQQKLALEKLVQNQDTKTYLMNFGRFGAAQFHQMFTKGRIDYIDHLPDCTINATIIPIDEIQEALETYENSPITIDYANYGYLTKEEFTYIYLQVNYDYDAGTNTMIYNGRQVSVQVISLETVGNPIINWYYYVVVNLKEIDGTYTATLRLDYFNVYIKTFKGDSPQAIFKYTVQNTGRVKYTAFVATYTDTLDYIVEDTGDNVYAIENFIYGIKTNLSVNRTNPFEAFPVILIRNNYRNVVDWDKPGNKPPTITEERYKKTKALLKAIPMDIETLTDEIMKNPDVDKVNDAFVGWGLHTNPAKNYNVPVAAKYLWKHFELIYNELPIRPTGDYPQYHMIFREDPYYTEVGWRSKPIEIIEEVIGPIGTYTYVCESNRETYTYLGIINEYDEEGNITDSYLGEITVRPETEIGDNGGFGIFGGRDSFFNRTNTNIVIKRQITDTTIERMTLVDVEQIFYIRQGGFTGVKKVAPLSDVFLMPLLVRAVRNCSYMEQTSLYSDSVYLTFNTYYEITVKWYQTGLFGFILSIISIVLIVVFPPGGIAMLGISAAMMQIILISLIIVFNILQMAEIDIGIIGTIITVALAVLGFIDAGGFAGYTFTYRTILDLANIATGIMNYITTGKMEDLQGDMESFQNKFEEKVKQFEEIINSFNTSITPEFLVSLSKNNRVEELIPATLLSPSLLRYFLIDAYRDWDLLYQNPSTTYLQTATTVGVMDI